MTCALLSKTEHHHHAQIVQRTLYWRRVRRASSRGWAPRWRCPVSTVAHAREGTERKATRGEGVERLASPHRHTSVHGRRQRTSSAASPQSSLRPLSADSPKSLEVVTLVACVSYLLLFLLTKEAHLHLGQTTLPIYELTLMVTHVLPAGWMRARSQSAHGSETSINGGCLCCMVCVVFVRRARPRHRGLCEADHRSRWRDGSFVREFAPVGQAGREGRREARASGRSAPGYGEKDRRARTN